MPKIFKDSSGRFTLKTHETYKGINFICRGTSRNSKSEASKPYNTLVKAKVRQSDIVVFGELDKEASQCDLIINEKTVAYGE